MVNNSVTPIEPHPTLSEYYSGPAEKRQFLKNVFDETAGDYDRVEAALSLGSGRWYRRRALARAGLGKGMTVLDVATGTGLVAREVRRLIGEQGYVMGLDPSAGMLGRARVLLGIPAVIGVGEALPVEGNSFDFISMGYALRHLPDLRPAFAEYHRVLRPGGRVCLLEISRPRGRVKKAFLGAYFRGVLPALARVVGTSKATRELWKYYWETIDACVPPETVMEAMRAAGFKDVKRYVELGIFSEYTGTK